MDAIRKKMKSLRDIKKFIVFRTAIRKKLKSSRDIKKFIVFRTAVGGHHGRNQKEDEVLEGRDRPAVCHHPEVRGPDQGVKQVDRYRR